MNVANGASIAVLNVGIAISSCQSQLNLDLRIVALGQPHDPSHTGIYSYPDHAEHNAKVALVLAKLVRSSEVYPVI